MILSKIDSYHPTFLKFFYLFAVKYSFHHQGTFWKKVPDRWFSIPLILSLEIILNWIEFEFQNYANNNLMKLFYEKFTSTSLKSMDILPK